MAFKFEIIGKFLRVSDTVDGWVHINEPTAKLTYLRTRDDYFKFSYSEQQTIVSGVNSALNTVLGADNTNWTPEGNPTPKPTAPIFSAADVRDVDGVPIGEAGAQWADVNAFDLWLATNLGVENITVNCDGAEDWQPPAIVLGSFITSNVVILPALAGAGHYFIFASNQDRSIRGNIDLENNGVLYGGQAIQIHLHWLLSATPAPATNVLWEMDYAFISDGEDNETKIDGTILLDIDVSLRNASQQYTDFFASIAGANTAKVLQLTIRRNGQGAGSDNYGDDVQLYSLGIKKIV
jgi:hypothetical protein